MTSVPPELNQQCAVPLAKGESSPKSSNKLFLAIPAECGSLFIKHAQFFQCPFSKTPSTKPSPRKVAGFLRKPQPLLLPKPRVSEQLGHIDKPRGSATPNRPSQPRTELPCPFSKTPSTKPSPRSVSPEKAWSRPTTPPAASQNLVRLAHFPRSLQPFVTFVCFVGPSTLPHSKNSPT